MIGAFRGSIDWSQDLPAAKVPVDPKALARQTRVSQVMAVASLQNFAELLARHAKRLTLPAGFKAAEAWQTKQLETKKPSERIAEGLGPEIALALEAVLGREYDDQPRTAFEKFLGTHTQFPADIGTAIYEQACRIDKADASWHIADGIGAAMGIDIVRAKPVIDALRQ